MAARRLSAGIPTGWAWWVSEKIRGQTMRSTRGLRVPKAAILAWLLIRMIPTSRKPSSEAVGFLLNRPNWRLVYGDANFIDENGRVIGRFPARPGPLPPAAAEAMCNIPQQASFWRRSYGAKSAARPIFLFCDGLRSVGAPGSPGACAFITPRVWAIFPPAQPGQKPSLRMSAAGMKC